LAICVAESRLAGQCKVYASRTSELEKRISSSMPIPDVDTWKLVEALSLLAVLINADRVLCGDVFNLFGQTGPLHIIEDGCDRYLWAQPTLTGKESELGGRPDLVVTTSPETPTAKTILRVIECKCRRHLGAHDIRAEFGKAYDLGVVSYLIWSYWTPAPRAVSGAKRLGLDLVALGLDTQLRTVLIANPENLVLHVANTINMSKREKRFAETLVEYGQQAIGKTHLPT
jgi:hypothetical protein